MARVPGKGGDAASLHGEGWFELHGGLPDWEMFRFVERYHKKYHARVLDLLEGARPTWDSDEVYERPGTLAARRATEILAPEGIRVSAAHPSGSGDPEDPAGPRFFVSVAEAAARLAPAPPLPEVLAGLLWPRRKARRRARITDIGWTAVPPSSEEQVLHADVAPWHGGPLRSRRQSRGRFHHVMWQPDRPSSCAINVVAASFTEHGVEDWHYGHRQQVKAPGIVLDSEVLRGGGATGPGSWASTCSVQICSGEGWLALQTGGSPPKELLGLVCPIREALPASESADAAAAGGGEGSGKDADRLAMGASPCTGPGQEGREPVVMTPATGSACCWPEDAEVEAKFYGAWYPAKVGKRHRDGTYRLDWAGEDSFTERVPGIEIRNRRPGGCRCEVRERGRDVVAQASLLEPPRKRAKGLGPSVPETHRELQTRGLVTLAEGLPWRWALLDFVEECHARFNELIVMELEALRSTWMPVCAQGGCRPGDFAAAKASERLAKRGIAVYAGPPSRSEEPPYELTGPRFYVSLTRRARARLGEAPPMPEALVRLLWPHAEDSGGPHRARGLGWTLVPPGSDPQELHADLWGGPGYPRDGRIRWPHLLWKRGAARVSTEVALGRFTKGQTESEDYDRLTRAGTPAAIMDSEVLHRGAAVPAAGGGSCLGWGSTCSIELCSPAGWRAWQAGTGGTVADSTDEAWQMLSIHCCGRDADAGCGNLSKIELDVVEEKQTAAAEAKRLAALRAEQLRWEGGA